MGSDHIGSRGVGIGREGTSVVGRGGLAVAGVIDIDLVLVLVQHDEGGVAEGEDEEAVDNDEGHWLWVGASESHDRSLMELGSSRPEESDEVAVAKAFSTSFTIEEAEERHRWQIIVDNETRSCCLIGPYESEEILLVCEGREEEDHGKGLLRRQLNHSLHELVNLLERTPCVDPSTKSSRFSPPPGVCSMIMATKAGHALLPNRPMAVAGPPMELHRIWILSLMPEDVQFRTLHVTIGSEKQLKKLQSLVAMHLISISRALTWKCSILVSTGL
ncbi:hypothetical protein B296_00016046 [Ensete ventricosum]|uniref:Uncharacterized protein n=1 Tax=Ensete ventricosum TaxID=4639 RepID=A0A426YRC6_ENSVE|nr:hypothetical protein B296_00016046 [Ensete ventricosum]